MELIYLKCPSCGGDLSIPKTSGMIYCNFCGNKFLIPENISNKPDITNFMILAKRALDANDAREAIQYFNKVLEIEPDNYEALIGKGYAVFFTSTLANPQLLEMVSIFEKGYELAPPEKKDSACLEIKANTYGACKVFFEMALSHYKEFKGRFTDMSSIQKNMDDFHEWSFMVIWAIDGVLKIPGNAKASITLCEYGIYVLNNNNGTYKRSFVNEKIKEYSSWIQEYSIRGYKSGDVYQDPRQIYQIFPSKQTNPIITDIRASEKRSDSLLYRMQHTGQNRLDNLIEHQNKQKYWDEHPEVYKAHLEEEKRKQAENEERRKKIGPEITAKTASILELGAKIKELKDERGKLGVFAIMQKREIDEQISTLVHDYEEKKRELESLRLQL